MEDTHPDFFGHVAILTEASRLNPEFARQVEEAATDERIDQLVEEGRKIVSDATDYDF